MLKPLTENEKVRIINNVVAACKDIAKLNSTVYKFLYLANGFIAHYDIHGFKSHYTENFLYDDVQRHANMNKWSNFREGDTNYEYYMSKADVYARILAKL